jgi:uridine kinase/adenylate cyclase class IV
MAKERQIKVLNVPLTEETLISLGATRVETFDIKDIYYKPQNMEKWEKCTYRVRETGKPSGKKECDITRTNLDIDYLNPGFREEESFKVSIGNNYPELTQHLFDEQFSYEKKREIWKLDRLKIFVDRVKLDSVRKEGRKIELPTELAKELDGTILKVEYQEGYRDGALQFLKNLGLNEERVEPRNMPQLMMERLFGHYESVERGITEIVRRMKTMKKDGPKFIFLTGASGSGKTPIAQEIADALDAKVINMDDFFAENTPELFKRYETYDLLDFIDLPEITRVLEDISNGQSTKVPIYSFIKGEREGYRSFELSKSNTYVIEGTFALSIEELSKWYDLTVSVESIMHLAALRRLIRDKDQRGKSPEKNIRLIKSAIESFKYFIEPKGRKAEIRIENSYNPLNFGECRGKARFELDLSKMIEENLEYKVKVLGVDFEEIRSKLKGDIDFVYDKSKRYPRQKIEQVDTYYIPKDTKDRENIVRMRKENVLPKDACIFMFRYQQEDNSNNFRKILPFQCLVRETDLVSLLEIYDQVGEVEKERTEFVYKDEVRLNFDKGVRGYVGDTKGYVSDVLEIKSKSLDKLKELLIRLDIKDSQLSNKTYIELMKN